LASDPSQDALCGPQATPDPWKATAHVIEEESGEEKVVEEVQQRTDISY
jgi:hypothetical protein